MAKRFIGEFPSDEAFVTPLSQKQLPTGDQLRAGLRRYPVVECALLVPSAHDYAYGNGMSSGDVTNLSRRAGEDGSPESYFRTLTGFTVYPHSGYAIDLSSAFGNEFVDDNPFSNVTTKTVEQQSEVARAMAEGRTAEELLGIGMALIQLAQQAQTA